MKGIAVQACAFAAFSGVLFGMDQGNYNGASQFDSFFQTFCVDGGYGTLEQCRAPSSQKPTKWVNVEMFFAPVLQIGSAISSLWMAPLISRRYGRRACIFWGAVVSFWGMVCIATSRMSSVFILARIVTGIGVGAVTYATPQYTSELADKDSRGRLTSMFQLATVSGVVIAQAITLKSDMHWSVPFAIPCLPALLIAIGIFRFPESPRWVLQNRSREEAEDILKQLRGCSDGDGDGSSKSFQAARDIVREELREIVAATEQEQRDEREQEREQEQERNRSRSSSSSNSRSSSSSRRSSSSNRRSHSSSSYGFMMQPDLRWRVLIACFLQLAQQFTGINGFTTLGTQFFKNAGVENIYLSNFLPSVTSLTGTVLQLGMIDRFGRRPLLLVGMAMMGGSLGLAGVLLMHDGQLSSLSGTVLVVAVCTFTFAFGFSWGPIPWVYGSEVFPFAIKDRAMSLSVGTNYAANVVVLLVISQLAAWSNYGLCFVLCANCALTLVVTYYLVPETAGRSLEEISADFKQAAAAFAGGEAEAESESSEARVKTKTKTRTRTRTGLSHSYQSIGRDEDEEDDDDDVLVLTEDGEDQGQHTL